MTATDELASLLGAIYDGALDWQAWPTALTRLADVTGGWVVTLGIYDERTQAFAGVAPRIGPDYMKSYAEHWASRNTLWQRAMREPVGSIMFGYDQITRDELVGTEFYNDWCQPQGIDWAIGTNVLKEDQRLGIVGVHRPWQRGDFEGRSIKLFAAVAPHLQRALQLQLRLATLAASGTSSLEVLNRLHQGVLLVDAAARVIFANRAAEVLFAEGDGLRSDATGVRAATPAATAVLRKMIAECTGIGEDLDGSGGPIALPRAPGRMPLSGLVIPLRATTGWLHFSRPAAIVFVTDPERQRAIRKAGLQQQFGLTQAEAAFVVEILRGEGLQASADALGISVTTARTHLTHTFEKSGTRRQAELVRFILLSQAEVADS
jgi:DNA-binding CsgD family transcriptional regulator/PAS domain-containing protein